MKDIMLSVVITNYNQIDYIETAVESILKQDIGYEYEILIGDDGSSDGSYELIIEKYGNNKRIKIFQMDRDNSIKEFSNWRHSRLIWYLLERTEGKYLSVLDGDDYYCGKDGLKRKIDILEAEENKDCIACTSATMSDVDGKIERIVYPNEMKKLNIKEVFFAKQRFFYQIATCVFRRTVLQYADFNLPELQGADQAILYFILHYGKLYYTPEYDYVNRKLPNSIWHKGNAAEHALRIVIGTNISRKLYNDFYFRRFWKDRNSIMYVYYNRKYIPQMIDWNMWSAWIDKYNLEIVKWLMGNKDVSLKTKIEMPISIGVLKVFEVFVYLKGAFSILFSKEVSFKEKKERIYKVLKAK